MPRYASNFDRRKQRVRLSLKKKAYGKMRLSVFRSGQNIYAQVIDDSKGTTLACASSIEKALKIKSGSTVEAAKIVGKSVAERALKKGCKEVVFDRGGYLFHGRVSALANGAREAGLKF